MTKFFEGDENWHEDLESVIVPKTDDEASQNNSPLHPLEHEDARPLSLPTTSPQQGEIQPQQEKSVAEKQSVEDDELRVIEWIRECQKPVVDLMDDVPKIPGPYIQMNLFTNPRRICVSFNNASGKFARIP